VADAVLERTEGGEPAGVARPQREAPWDMEETRPLSGHGVLVATSEVEGALADGREVGGDGEEAVVAVDDHQRLRRERGHQGGELAHHGSRVEEDVAEEDELRRSPADLGEEALGERAARLGRDAQHLDQALFFQPPGLPLEGVELGVAGDDARPLGETGEEPEDELVGVGGEDERARVREVELLGEVALRLWPHHAEDVLPLVVGEPGEVQPVGARCEEPAEVRLQHGAVVLRPHRWMHLVPPARRLPEVRAPRMPAEPS